MGSVNPMKPLGLFQGASFQGQQRVELVSGASGAGFAALAPEVTVEDASQCFCG